MRDCIAHSELPMNLQRESVGAPGQVDEMARELDQRERHRHGRQREEHAAHAQGHAAHDERDREREQHAPHPPIHGGMPYWLKRMPVV